jgi:four helix bundle protein
MPDYRTNKAWQHAHHLVLEIYESTKAGFPSHEKFGLVSQMRRAAVSIPANIAEGSGRASPKEYLQFLHIAKGSLNELEYYLLLAQELRFIPAETSVTLLNVHQEVGKTLSGLIESLRGRR